MAHIADLISSTLALEGHQGSVNDQMSQWLLSELPPGTEGQLTELWSLFWDANEIPPGQHNDRKLAWLQTQGETEQALPDAWHSYWVSRLSRSIVAYANSMVPPHAE